MTAVSRPTSRFLVENGLLLAGHTTATAGFEIGRVAPQFHLMLFTTAGKGRLMTSQMEAPLNPDDLLIVPARRTNHVHATYGDDWSFVWFRLEPGRQWDQVDDLGTAILHNHDARELAMSLDRFLVESVSETPTSLRAAMLYSQLIVTYLERHLDLTQTPHDIHMQHRFNRLWSEVSASLARHWTVEDLCEHMFLSKSHFIRLCRVYCGASPMQIIKRMRMEMAQGLLRSDDMSVAQVADLVGYTDQFAFSTAFRKATGLSPTEYRDS